jgi:DNA-binding response OmpR family regulator
VFRREGLALQLARNAEEARRIFDAYQAELALMVVDLMSGGFRFINSIPTRKPRVPVVFTTTNTERDLHAVTAQGFPCLAKPFKPQQLVDIVRCLFAPEHDS